MQQEPSTPKEAAPKLSVDQIWQGHSTSQQRSLRLGSDFAPASNIVPTRM